MGWFWGKDGGVPPVVSDAPPAIQTRRQPSSSSSTTTTTTPTSSSPSSSSSYTKPNSPPPREPTDTQIANFLALAENPASASTTTTTTSEHPPSYAYNPDETPADSQLPTTMSCRQAFDLATGCQGMAGQLRHMYRYGEFRSCAAHWADFWFCMRAKGSGDGPVKEDMIRTHYRIKEKEKYYEDGKRSSEEVWSPREKKVPEETFFNEPINPPVVDHHEWRRTELERRRKIREMCEKDERQR